MAWKVRVSYKPWNYKRDYGTGKEGKGRPFTTKGGATKRATEIKLQKGETVSVIKV